MSDETPAERTLSWLRSGLSRRGEWILATVAVVGTLLAFSSFLAPELLSLFGGGLGWVPGQVAVTYVLLGAVIAVPALWWLNRSGGTQWEPFGEPRADKPERTGLKPGMAEQLHTATVARYEGRVTDSSEAIHAELFEGAVRAVRTGRGIDVERAREAVRTGAWTDDPVAAAVLADDVDYPVRERLRGHLDPGGAYQRRIDRTLDAIEATRRSGGDR